MHPCQVTTIESFQEVAKHTKRRYETMRSDIARALRDPTLPEDAVAILTGVDDQAATSVEALSTVIACEPGAFILEHTVKHARASFELIDVLEDNVPDLLS